MFLDDELLQITKQAELTTPEGVQRLNVALCEKCELYYKAKLGGVGIPHPSQIKATLDRTFNLWDSFVKMLEKDSDKKLNILAPLLKKHSFKYQFLQNEQMYEIYTKLGGKA